MEKSSIDLLTDFAKKNNLRCSSSIRSTKGIIQHRGSLIDIKFFVLEYFNNSSYYYFCAFDSGYRDVYSGLFVNYSKQKVQELKVSPKFWFDKLSFQRKRKTGISELDKKLNIACESDKIVKDVVTPKVSMDFLELSKKVAPIELIVDNNFLDYNPDLEWASIVGIQTNRWILEEKELKLFLEDGSKLLNLIRKN
jgi:hypothetical protein